MDLIEMKELIKGANGWSSPSNRKKNSIYKKYGKAYSIPLLSDTLTERFPIGRELFSYFITAMSFDALIVNSDRHHGNWGILQNTRNNRIIEFCPLYDSGSGLFSGWNDEKALKVSADKRVFEGYIRGAESMVRKSENISNSNFSSLLNTLYEEKETKGIYENFCDTLRRYFTNSAIKEIVLQVLKELPPQVLSINRRKFIMNLLATSRDLILMRDIKKKDVEYSLRQDFVLNSAKIGAFTVQQYSDRFGINTELAQGEINDLVKKGELKIKMVNGVNWFYK
jgi:hypothetical protein